MANNANLGRLPTLGLNQYKAEDFGDNSRNPFYVQPTTEKMLVVRELEREFKDINKFEKDALKVHQKMTATRRDRTGTIREIANIPSNPAKDKKHTQGLAGQQSSEELKDNNKQKLNIFDTQDSTMLKHETLARLGHDERALIAAEESSQAS